MKPRMPLLGTILVLGTPVHAAEDQLPNVILIVSGDPALPTGN